MQSLPENIPVALAGLDDLAVRLSQKILAETERVLERARRAVGARVRGDAHDARSTPRATRRSGHRS